MKKLRVALAGVAALAAASFWAYEHYWNRDFAALEHYAIVKSNDTPEIALIDTRSDELGGRITLPRHPDFLSVSASLNRIVYANRAEKNLTIMDIQGHVEDIVIELPLTPDAMTVAPNGQEVALVNQQERTVVSISLSDGEIQDVITTITNPLAATYSEDSEFLYAPDGETKELQVFSTAAGMMLEPLPIALRNAQDAASFSSLTRTPNGLFGFFTDKTAGQMPMVRLRDWQQVQVLPVGQNPQRPYITADGRYIIVANTGESTTTVMSTDRFETLATLPGVSSLAGISTGFFETLAFLASDTEGRAIVLDLEDLTFLGEIDLGGTPSAPVGDADGRRIYVAVEETGEVLVFDTFSRKISARLQGVISRPAAISMAKTNNYCH